MITGVNRLPREVQQLSSAINAFDGKRGLLFGATADTFPQKGHGRATKYSGVVILDGRRTPFGDLGGRLKRLTPTQLALSATQGVLSATEIDPKEIDDSLWGNIIPGGNDTPYLARHVPLLAGGRFGTTGTAVNKRCASGLMVADMAARILGTTKDTAQDNIFLVGGAESMSRAPLASYEAMGRLISVGKRMQGAKNPVMKIGPAIEYFKLMRQMRKDLGHDVASIAGNKPPRSSSQFTHTLRDGLTDVLVKCGMLDTAENLSALFRFAEAELDAWSELSQHRADDAAVQGKRADEITPVHDASGRLLLAEDEGVRGFSTKSASLAKFRDSLRRVGKLGEFHLKPDNATHTAGNASRIVDGAAAMLVTNEETAARWSARTGKQPLGKIIATAEAGVAPDTMGYGAAKAAKMALKAAGLDLKDVSLIEVNEAFASVALAAMKDWEQTYQMPLKEIQRRTNVNGGAIALGHPLSATGVRLVITVLKELQRRNERYGLVTVCVGGGEGMAMVVENAAYRA